MAKKSELLTSSEFASKAGIPVSTVSKLIRAEKIKAVKKSGKWMISPSEIKVIALKEASKSRKPTAKKRTSNPIRKKGSVQAEKSPVPAPEREKQVSVRKTYTVAEFAEVTYLTEYGVAEWLKNGLLSGQRDAKGDWQIDAANLEVPNVKRLVRQDRIA
jgi:predicted site-specific integrase-resolvase